MRAEGRASTVVWPAIVHDDSLWVYDSTLRRISVFDLQGDYARSFTVEPTGDPVRPNRLYGLAGVLGDTALVMLPRPYPADQRPRPMIYWDSVPNLLHDRDGTLLDPVGPASGMEIQARTEPRQSAGDRPFGRLSAAATLALAPTLAACGADAPAELATVRDSAGITIVENAPGATSGCPAGRWPPSRRSASAWGKARRRTCSTACGQGRRCRTGGCCCLDTG